MTVTDPRTGAAELSLDGTWGFHPGDTPDGQPPSTVDDSIAVPGLWQAHGHLTLDGVAWYTRDVDLGEDLSGAWTLHFAAVMDEAAVHVNGALAGTHTGGYTPFRLDVTDLLRPGRNTIAVRVHDVPAGDPRHLRAPHGKQGWKNDLFPSPPSLYMSYGGIWQPVTLLRHGPVSLLDPFVNADPDRPRATVRVRNHGLRTTATVACTIAGATETADVDLDAGEEREVAFTPALSGLARWTPRTPALHTAVFATGGHTSEVRFGVRTVAAEHGRVWLNGEPLRVQAALVQGFRADTLYAEGDRAAIEREVRAARAAGLNMLRLHIKAFDPVYLDVCDELGMLVHCDLPVAEPIAVDELDDTGPLAEACAAVAAEQVRRDRNHPSVVLWSAMNEIGAENTDRDVRATGGYERFARMLHRIVTELDGTRPVIENDYIEPSPRYVYASPILTAHWYGRLSRAYLAELARRCAGAYPGHVLLVSEFGDWGLPALTPRPAEPPFWWPHHLERDLAGLPWPAGADAFVEGTQRYQGLADRLQIELFRRTPGIAGWCLTELTDVPHEYNGLWDLRREPKPAAVEQVAAACRATLPTAVPAGVAWHGFTGGTLRLSTVVANDAPAATGRLRVTVSPGGAETVVDGLALPAHGPGDPVTVELPLPQEEGRYTVGLTWIGGGEPVEAEYPLHVFAPPAPGRAGEVLGSPRDADAVARAGGAGGVLVVGA
ncbi:glycoside hydrolase family 2 protein, partial [Dactylosporangium salmoneum]|uniref:glycoside hydrolase family 2 protein n=1 Tax=Dactylosporangium salmoneum TaxID=53361 RepID=UPI0031D31CCD